MYKWLHASVSTTAKSELVVVKSSTLDEGDERLELLVRELDGRHRVRTRLGELGRPVRALTWNPLLREWSGLQDGIDQPTKLALGAANGPSSRTP